MDDHEKEVIKSLVKLKNNLLVWKSNELKIKRVSLGYIKIAGKVWRTRDVIAVLLVDIVDRRTSESFEMARSLPQMTITKSNAKTLGLKIYRTGGTCINGHTGWRFISNGACITCRGLLK